MSVDVESAKRVVADLEEAEVASLRDRMKHHKEAATALKAKCFFELDAMLDAAKAADRAVAAARAKLTALGVPCSYADMAKAAG